MKQLKLQMDLQIIKIASDNKNQKILKKYTHEIKNKNSICGDEITIKLLINNKIIERIVRTSSAKLLPIFLFSNFAEV